MTFAASKPGSDACIARRDLGPSIVKRKLDLCPVWRVSSSLSSVVGIVAGNHLHAATCSQPPAERGRRRAVLHCPVSRDLIGSLLSERQRDDYLDTVAAGSPRVAAGHVTLRVLEIGSAQIML